MVPVLDVIPKNNIELVKSVIPERSRQGVGTGHESSNLAASHYLT